MRHKEWQPETEEDKRMAETVKCEGWGGDKEGWRIVGAEDCGAWRVYKLKKTKSRWAKVKEWLRVAR
jgi:hypothetical protein